jgi:hypothetical protein
MISVETQIKTCTINRRKRMANVPPQESDDDEPVYFCFSATLRIFGDGLDIDAISKHLGLTPTHAHQKGELRGPRHRSPPWTQDMWSYTPAVNEASPLHEHIMALWDAIRPHIRYLRELKEQGFTVDVFCGYRSNSGTAGFEIDHRCLGLFMELQVPLGVSVIVA